MVRCETSNLRGRSPPSPVDFTGPTNPIYHPPGKNWHDTKKPFRPSAGLTSYAKRQEVRKQQDAVKEREREMKEEKEAERKVRFPLARHSSGFSLG